MLIGWMKNFSETCEYCKWFKKRTHKEGVCHRFPKSSQTYSTNYCSTFVEKYPEIRKGVEYGIKNLNF